MENIGLWTETIDWIELVINLVALVVPTLLAGWGGTTLLKRLWAALRPEVDEGTDWLNVTLGHLLAQNPDLLAKLISGIGDAAFGEPEPETADQARLGDATH